MRESRSFVDVSYDEAIRRATAMVPVLRERAAEADRGRVVPPETMEDLHRSGLLRALQPKRWGGMELDIVATFDIGHELARGCASTSWTAVNLLIHHWMLALRFLSLCGHSARGDVRTLRPLRPLSVHPGATLARDHARLLLRI